MTKLSHVSVFSNIRLVNVCGRIVPYYPIFCVQASLSYQIVIFKLLKLLTPRLGTVLAVTLIMYQFVGIIETTNEKLMSL